MTPVHRDTLSSELRKKLLVEFSGRAVPYPRDRTILQLFEAQAAKTPDLPAMMYDDVTLTYRQLEQKANGLAAELQRLGIGRGDITPLVMNNCLELPISMIALMKLAAPFLPVDETWPRDRLRAILSDVNPKVVLCSAQWDSLSGLELPTRLVAHRELEERQSSDFGRPAGMEDLIYGFYTSGSTGLPKCTLNIHHGLLNRFLYMSRRFGSEGRDVVLQNSRHVFDSSIWQMLWPLTNGSRVVIPKRQGILDLTQTIEIIHRYGITMTDFVPSIFNAMVELLGSDRSQSQKLTTLRQLLIGGEEISPKAVQQFRVFLPHVGITNTYGPTEASIGCVFHEVTAADGDSIPIGRTIDNTYAVILDEARQLVAPGTIGEIYIGGDCLGRGYLNDPEKTRAAFVDNPFPEIPGTQLYRTGDLAYFRPDGLINFVGRADQQVKIGGVRIELTEIEAVLSTHPQVREAKVIVHGEGDQKMLIAYVVAQSPVEPAVLKEHAARSLPKYSLPKQVILLERMPLTPNGKADRKALARMAEQRPEQVREDEALSPDERAIKGIWLELLRVGDVGVTDNFFACGGDSLMAQRLALALEQRLKVKVPLREVVAAPTIRELAERVRQGGQRPEPAAAWTVDTLRAEVKLAPDIVAAAQAAPRKPGVVFLTGATGFIGAQLLHDLLKLPEVRVLCLVRADSEAPARARLEDNLKHYGLWEEGFSPRITPVLGELGRPLFGLSEQEFERLAQTTDTLVHNGAMVNLLLDYAAHRGPNVEGTVDILRLACRGRTKLVHYISTLTVFPQVQGADGKEATPVESEPWDDGAVPTDGYSQSKWVAEKILALGRARGIPSIVYRLGEVMPHSRTGIPSPRGLADTILKGCLKLGMCFESSMKMDYTPVDYVSQLIVGTIKEGRNQNDYLHVLQTRSLSFNEIFMGFQRQFGLRKVSYREFWRSLRETALRGPDEADLARLLALMPEPVNEAVDPDGTRTEGELASLFSGGTRTFSTERAAQLLRELAIHWPPVDQPVLDAYVAHYRDAMKSGLGAR